jgi:hypothetical protein
MPGGCRCRRSAARGLNKARKRAWKWGRGLHRRTVYGARVGIIGPKDGSAGGGWCRNRGPFCRDIFASPDVGGRCVERLGFPVSGAAPPLPRAGFLVQSPSRRPRRRCYAGTKVPYQPEAREAGGPVGPVGPQPVLVAGGARWRPITPGGQECRGGHAKGARPTGPHLSLADTSGRVLPRVAFRAGVSRSGVAGPIPPITLGADGDAADAEEASRVLPRYPLSPQGQAEEGSAYSVSIIHTYYTL